MAVVNRISPGSAFKVGMVAYGLVGLALGTLCTVVAAAGMSFGSHARMPFMRGVGVLAVIVCPIVYGVVGGLAAALGAAIYNLVSGWVGGLQVDIRP